MRILAYDLSLTETGFAFLDDSDWRGTLQHDILKPKKMPAIQRLAWFEWQILKHVSQFRPEAVVLEGYSMRSMGRTFGIGEMGGVVRLALFKSGVTTFQLPPKSLKAFMADDGNADKDEMKKRLGIRTGIWVTNDNRADAISLALALMSHLSSQKAPFFLTEKRTFSLRAFEILFECVQANGAPRTRTRS